MNTARANKNPDNNAFFLLFVFVRIVEISNNIIANSQGFILSESAAGSIIHRNFNLSFASDFVSWIAHELDNVCHSHFNHLQVSSVQDFLSHHE